MAISPIQTTPNMDMGSLTTAINDNFRQVESENRSKVMRDESGNNRIILGRMPDGTYGLLIMKPGYDALSIFS